MAVSLSWKNPAQWLHVSRNRRVVYISRKQQSAWNTRSYLDTLQALPLSICTPRQTASASTAATRGDATIADDRCDAATLDARTSTLRESDITHFNIDNVQMILECILMLTMHNRETTLEYVSTSSQMILEVLNAFWYQQCMKDLQHLNMYQRVYGIKKPNSLSVTAKWTKIQNENNTVWKRCMFTCLNKAIWSPRWNCARWSFGSMVTALHTAYRTIHTEQ